MDKVNQNRVFPGDPNGTSGEQMAHALRDASIVHVAAEHGIFAEVGDAGGVSNQNVTERGE